MTVMKKDRKREILKGEKFASKETDDLRAMPPSQPVLTQESLVGKLRTPIPDVVHHELAQSLELLGDISVGKEFRYDEFERMK